MSNYLTPDELRGIINVIDALDKVDQGDVSFDVLIYDCNGENVGTIKRINEVGPAFYPAYQEYPEYKEA